MSAAYQIGLGSLKNVDFLFLLFQLVRNFVDMASAFSLTKLQPIRYITADLRALVLVTQARPGLATGAPGLRKALDSLRAKTMALLEPLNADQEGAEGTSSSLTVRY